MSGASTGVSLLLSAKTLAVQPLPRIFRLPSPVTRLLLLLLLCAAPALSQTAGDLRNNARQIAARVKASQTAGSFDEAAQKRAIEDKAANSGAESREKESLLGAYEAISDPLDQVYEQSAGDLDRKAKKIMEDDGDLEALYETPAYKQGQVVGLQALYYLNWLRYYGARLHDGAQRKALLEKAQKGFGELTPGEKRGGEPSGGHRFGISPRACWAAACARSSSATSIPPPPTSKPLLLIRRSTRSAAPKPAWLCSTGTFATVTYRVR